MTLSTDDNKFILEYINVLNKAADNAIKCLSITNNYILGGHVSTILSMIEDLVENVVETQYGIKLTKEKE